ncbi:hypothetical protein SIXOD_v1c26630 [Spiroplasma ixodetis Y32]|nr:hypothetical protein SIXOD_v1c26630 [Spiroplasma ixodetis Y32]
MSVLPLHEFNSFYDTASKPLPFLDFNQLAHDSTRNSKQ